MLKSPNNGKDGICFENLRRRTLFDKLCKREKHGTHSPAQKLELDAKKIVARAFEKYLENPSDDALLEAEGELGLSMILACASIKAYNKYKELAEKSLGTNGNCWCYILMGFNLER